MIRSVIGVEPVEHQAQNLMVRVLGDITGSATQCARPGDATVGRRAVPRVTDLG
jgi:hypothetical protein